MSMNKDQIKGRAKVAEGTVQETVGRMVGNEHQEANGLAKKNLGKVQAALGDARQQLKDSFKGV